MLELRIIMADTPLSVFDLPAAIGRAGAAKELGDQVEAMIAFLDDLQGDVDLEDSECGSHQVDALGNFLGKETINDGEDREPDDDAADVAWVEWGSRGRHKLHHDGEVMARGADGNLHEDDEAGGDETDASFPEWCNGDLSQPMMKAGHMIALGMEDAEDDDCDRCLAGDDMVRAGPTYRMLPWPPRRDEEGHEIGDDCDAEDKVPPAWGVDQDAPLFVTRCANDE